MIVNWIRADVADRAGFDAGQRAWRAMAGTPGLTGQGGGWSSSTPDTAVVLAIWRDRAAHEAFRVGVHDRFAAAQRGTYGALAVDLLDVVEWVGDGAFGLDGGVLRTAWCPLRPGRAGHALDVQRRVWFPAMIESGMSWGLVGRAGTEALLVVSRWPSRGVHEAYRARVPALRDAAAVVSDVRDVVGDLVALEPGWSVLAPDTV